MARQKKPVHRVQMTVFVNRKVLQKMCIRDRGKDIPLV